MIDTKIVFGNEARHQLFKGLEFAAQAVGCTLGPKGKTVIISQADRQPIVTKDGVTVSKAISFKDPMMRMGAELIKEAASQTNDTAGDGTTTATILTHALVKEGLRLLDAGYDATLLKQGIEVAVTNVIEALRSSAKMLTTVEEIAQVATVSANGDKTIGELIASAMSKVGHEGIITVEDAKGIATTLNVVEGMQFERGYLSPYFVNNTEKMHSLHNDCKVLVTDKKISTMKELVPLLEKIVQTRTSLLIIADEVDGEALHTLVTNRVRGDLPVVAIKAPGYGLTRDAILNDLCILTGANLVSSKTGLSIDKMTLQDLGTLKKVVVDAKSTTLVTDGRTEQRVKEHLNDIRAQLEDITLTSDELTMLKMRVAKLSGGVAVIRVGGSTEIEMIERKHRIEDALNATRAATEEGIVSGGGTALLDVVETMVNKFKENLNQREGFEAVLKACRAPFERIVTNGGKNPEVVANEMRRLKKGYNAATGEYVDLMSDGIIDPVKVTRTAIENAASVANVFLSLDAAVIED